jgi:predicted kinase
MTDTNTTTKIVLMSGVPGSGKSTYTSTLKGEVVVCSADHYFMVDGEYRFDFTKLGAAHGACLRKFTETLREARADVLVVDNTNTSELELAPYVALAAAYSAPVEIVTVLCDPAIAAARNTHGVPEAGVRRMDAALRSRELPPFWNVKLTTLGE